jgi:hypothetical protein
MADFLEDVEAGSMLLMLAIGVFIIWLVYNGFKSASCLCILKKGLIPGITGPTAAQVNAPKDAAAALQSGGKVIWNDTSSTDYDYQQPNGDVVQARSTFWGQLTGTPVTYTTVPRDSYVYPNYGTVAAGMACCYQTSCTALPVW